MIIKVVLEDVGARKNGVKACDAGKYSFTRLRTKLHNSCL